LETQESNSPEMGVADVTEGDDEKYSRDYKLVLNSTELGVTAAAEDFEEYYKEDYEEYYEDGYGDGYDLDECRPLYYDLPAPFANLAGSEIYDEWLLSRSDSERINECVAVSFIRDFDIAYRDFNKANNELLEIITEIGFSPEDGYLFELYPVNLIFTFDNELIKDYFRWENSPIPSERAMGEAMVAEKMKAETELETLTKTEKEVEAEIEVEAETETETETVTETVTETEE